MKEEMDIIHLELTTSDLQAQQKYYSDVLGLSANISDGKLEVKACKTDLDFVESPGFDGAYHLAFNIPENQIAAAREWLAPRSPLLKDEHGNDHFHHEGWNADAIYFKDPAGNILEFIARHDLRNAVDGDFDSDQILSVSEIGLPSEDVVGWANELCVRLGVSVFRQEPNENFTPVGDNDGLFILPAKDRIWYPNTGVPARLLPIKVRVEVNGKRWEVRGVPYEIIE
jgi:catechol 2,3-dioxygenase-like lactoylglutathione lyase family enzyme